MTVIAIPAPIPAFQTMESTPARALTFATDLRTAAVGIKDVQSWATTVAGPGWEGDSRETHDHAASRFAARLDAAEAALDRAVVAADRFEARLQRLSSRRLTIDTERKTVNRAAEALRADVEAAGVDAPPEQVAELQRRSGRLTGRATDVIAEIDDWTRDYQTAETELIAALAQVDTVAEGERAADDPGRPDVDALTDQFNQRRGDPAALHAWWTRLSRAEQQALLTEHPELVGNADGVPTEQRDEANRAAVESTISHLGEREADGQLTDEEERILENARYVHSSVEKFHTYIDPVTGRERLRVLVFKPGIHSGDGAVAIGFGDPDTADHVSVNVPGLTTETSSTEGNLDRTRALHDAALAEDNGSVASVYWLDYDAPSGNPLKPWETLDFGGVALTGKADAGGERFGDFIDGLRASDEGPPAHLTAIGHSYGSTLLGHALEDGLPVDDAVVIGSPGQPTSTAGELTSADVWVGSKDYDPVSLLGSGERGGVGALGYDPAEDDFGGRRFATGDGSLRVQDLLMNHSSYFADESLDNMAHIVTDRDSEVTYQPHRGDDGGGYLTLSELLATSTAASGGELVLEGGEWVYERSKDLGGLIVENSPLSWMLGR